MSIANKSEWSRHNFNMLSTFK